MLNRLPQSWRNRCGHPSHDGRRSYMNGYGMFWLCCHCCRRPSLDLTSMRSDLRPSRPSFISSTMSFHCPLAGVWRARRERSFRHGQANGTNVASRKVCVAQTGPAYSAYFPYFGPNAQWMLQIAISSRLAYACLSLLIFSEVALKISMFKQV